MTARPLSPLTEALHQHSPRFTQPSTPWQAMAVHGGVMLLWGLLLWAAFHQHSVLAWSVGVVYASYDTALLVFVAWQTRDLRRALPPAAQPCSLTSAPRPSLGVIVAAHNEAAVLPITLGALLSQHDRPDQIIVADDGSIVNLEDMKPLTEESHCSKKPVRFVLEMNQGWFAKKGIKAGARLTGAPFRG